MVEEVLEEDSNSQKDNYVIISLEKIKHTQKTKIILKNNSTFTILTRLIGQTGIFNSQELTAKDIEKLIKKSAIMEAEDKALFLLSKSMHTKKGLYLKLLKRGFNREIVQNVLDKLDEMDYINDRAYAETWISHQLKYKTKSKNKLLTGLLKCGIDRKLAENVLNELVTDQTEEEALKKIMHKLKKKGIDQNKIRQRLFKQGFAAFSIQKAMDKYLEK